jgi:LacI family transcriptional regulator
MGVFLNASPLSPLPRAEGIYARRRRMAIRENVTSMKPHAAAVTGTTKMRRHVTIVQVAARARVGPATVSRVLNDGQVSATRRARVMEAIESLGYHPDAVARGLRSRVTKTIGFIVNDISNQLFASIMRGAAQVVREGGYSILLGTSDGDPRSERSQVRLLISRRVDGIILSLVDDMGGEICSLLGSLSIPLVLVDRQMPDLNADAILCDHQTGWVHATNYLLSIGHRRIALAIGREVILPYRERISAFRKALKAHGMAFQPEYLRTGPSTPGFGEQATADLLALSEPPTAIMAGSNQIAIGVLGLLRTMKISIPHQMSLLVADDVDVARLNNPAITVVARDMAQIGVTAGKLLIERLKGPHGAPRREVLLPTHLIVRDSCEPPAPI